MGVVPLNSTGYERKAMARKRLIADIIGTIGFILGMIAGCIIVQAELYMNPMDYQNSYVGLVFYCYVATAVVSFPFLAVQFILNRKNSLPLVYVAVAILIILVLMFLYRANLAGGVFLFMAWVTFPLLIGRQIFRIYKNRVKPKTMP